MEGLFEGQFDYIYFFYGLSLFLLGVICFSIGRSRLQKIPLWLLGLFGITQGLHEWLEMLQVIFGRIQLLSIFNLFILAVSFLFLFEFARTGLYRIKGVSIKRRMYIPFLLALPLGYKFGIDGWHIMICYLLGFPGTYFASRIIYEFYKNEAKRNHLLVFLSAMMASYAVLVSFIVPKANFPLANILNIETFYRAFGVPIPMVNGLVVLCMAMIAWSYSTTPSGIKYIPQARFIRFVPTKWLIALTIIILISAGWVFTNYLDYYAGIGIIESTGVDSPLNRLTKELGALSKATVNLSKASLLRQAVTDQEHLDAEKIKNLLKQYQNRYQALNFVLLDSEGKVLVSAALDDSAQMPGRLNSARPYFKNALAGDNGFYFELGSNYNERKYYVSYPVKNKENKIAGVIMLTKYLQAEPILQYRLLSIAITLFVCCLVIIFFLILRRRETLLDLVEKAHAELLTVDQMKSDFISIVSHELRTPLTSIRNAASILLKGGPAKRLVASEEKEMLDIILTNVDRQTKMVSDLLDISKIEEKLIPVNLITTDLVALAQEEVKSLQLIAQNKKVNLEFCPPAGKLPVLADPEHTRRILSNLIVNAIKFTPAQGKVTVRVEAAGQKAKVTVADTGMGISRADKEKLFSKFYRSSDAKAKQQSGWGLGLAISKSLVEVQGGQIGVESELGRGSIFYFTVLAAQG